MPFWGWANFLVPLFRTSPTAQGVFFQTGQYWTSSYYAGIGTVLLAAVAVWRVRDWRVRVLAGLLFWLWFWPWATRALLYCGVRSCFPGFGFLRYPVKCVILVLALAPLLAAFGVAALAAQNPRQQADSNAAVALLLLLADRRDRCAGIGNPPSPATSGAPPGRADCPALAFLVLVFLLGAAFLKSQGRRRALLGWPVAGGLLAGFGDACADAKSHSAAVRLFARPGQCGIEMESAASPRPIARHAGTRGAGSFSGIIRSPAWRKPTCETGWPFVPTATCWTACLKLTASSP